MTKYHSEFYNQMDNSEQWIRLTDGCFRNCWNCYAPTEKKVYDLPEIKRNKVRFLDMNFLYAHPDPTGLIASLRKIKVNKRVVKYTFLCGLDFTLFTKDFLSACKKSRVGRFNNKGNFLNGLTIAWDRGYDEADQFKKAIHMIEDAGYLRRNIIVFMLCNGKVTFIECVKKLIVLAKMRVQIADCWFDNQKRGSVNPIYWGKKEIEVFGKLCRAHNIAVLQRMYDSLDLVYSCMN